MALNETSALSRGFDYIEIVYHSKRLHGLADDATPAEYESIVCAATDCLGSVLN